MRGISIIIPVYNEEKILETNVKKLLKYLKTLKVRYEVIIGSNGSSDNTVEIGKKLSKRYKHINFFHTSQKGVGYAFIKAVKKSKFDYIFSVDMDLSVELKFIEKAIRRIPDYDIVIGSKQMGVQERSFLRKLPSFVFIFMVKVLFGLKYEDYSMAAKVYRKDFVLKHLKRVDSGTSYVIDLIYFAKKEGLHIVELPVYCHDTRKSKFNIFHEIFYRFFGLLRLKFKG